MGALASIPHLGNTFGGPVSVRATDTNRYDTDVSTRATIDILRALSRRYSADPSVRQALAQATAGLHGVAGDRDIACAIFYWVRSNIQFIEDEALLYSVLGVPAEELDKELLIVPPTMLAMPTPAGDCDDFSLLTACMCLTAGLLPYYVTVAAGRDQPRKHSHIYICVCLADERTHLCLDTGNRLNSIPPGWESGSVTRKTIWGI